MGCCSDCCIPPKESREPLHYDPDFAGPTRSRSCTDIFWLIVFIVFLGGWGYVGYYGIAHGDVQRLLAPIDSGGRRCGLDSGVTEKKYLVFFDILQCLSPNTPLTGCNTPQVCVEACPQNTINIIQVLSQTPSRLDEIRSNFVCTDEVTNVMTMNAAQAIGYINENKCAKYVVKSEPVLFRCIGDMSTLKCKEDRKTNPGRGTVSFAAQNPPDTCVLNPEEKQRSLVNRATALDSYVGYIVASWVTFFTRDEPELHSLSAQIVEDLVSSRWYLLGALFAVVLLCMLYIVILRWVVAPVVWASITGLLALLCFSLYLCYKNYEYFKANPVSLIQTTNIQGAVESYFAKASTWLVILIVVSVVVVILLLMVIFLRKRIVIAIALIREGSKAVSSIKSTMIFPIFPWAVQCCVIGYGVVVLVYLLSVGDSTFSVVNLTNDTDCNCNGVYTQNYQSCVPATFLQYCHSVSTGGACRQALCHFTGITNPTLVNYMILVNVVGFFWLMFFISGMSDLILANTFATWYWTFNKKNVPFFTLTQGIYRSVVFHMGTVALGSLIITIVRIIRLVLEYIDHKLKKYDNPVTRGLLCLCKCCCWCLENFLKFINKNAYIMCAIHGKNFCSSARDAFSLLMRNIVRVVVLDKVTDFIFFISKLLISIGVGISVYYILQLNFIYEVTQGRQLHYNYVPSVILGIATYLVTTLFFNVYAMAVDTLFLCFLEDCERNDGSPEKRYYMSHNLMKILGKRNKVH